MKEATNITSANQIKKQQSKFKEKLERRSSKNNKEQQGRSKENDQTEGVKGAMQPIKKSDTTNKKKETRLKEPTE